MSGVRRRDLLIGRARDMFARGVSMSEIATALGVSKNTVKNWSAYDRKHGLSWQSLRERMGDLSQDETLQMLRSRLARMVADGGTTGPDDPDRRKEHEAKLLNMTRIIKGCEKTADELTRLLISMREFAGYCADNLSEEDLAAARKAVEGFIEKLRRENS